MISYGAPAYIRRVLNIIFPFNAVTQNFLNLFCMFISQNYVLPELLYFK